MYIVYVYSIKRSIEGMSELNNKFIFEMKFSE